MINESQKAWYVVSVGDPRRMTYIDSAFKATHSEYTIWIPERASLERDKRKNKIVEEPRPLFPGYAFANFDYENNLGIDDHLRFHCGGRLLKKPGAKEPYILTPAEIDDIKTLEKSRDGLQSIASKYNLNIGDTIDISEGPFNGFRGKVMSLKKDKIIVSIDIFERTVATDIDPSCCMKVD